MHGHRNKSPTRYDLNTNWGPVADWYHGWVGKNGSKHHRELVIPAAIELLELKPRCSVLEIGAGHGTFIKGDSRKLSVLPELHEGRYDSVVFMLSLQDMEPLEK